MQNEQVNQIDTKVNPNLTVGEAVTFWQKYKNIIIPLLTIILSALGGGVATNPQSIGQALPDVYGVAAIKKDVEDIKAKLKACNCNSTTTQEQGGVIQVN